MKVTPKTEKELLEMNLIPPGDYAFEVLDAQDKQSKKGSDMIELTLGVFVGDSRRLITDFLLDAMPGKLFHFCQYTGLAGKYASGDLKAEDCLGKTGFLSIKTQKGKKKDGPGNEYWPDRSSVDDYNRGEFKKAPVVGGAPKDGDKIEGDPY